MLIKSNCIGGAASCHIPKQYVDRLKLKIGEAESVAVAKSSQLHEEKGSGAPRGVIRQPAGVARRVGGRGALGGVGMCGGRAAGVRGEGCARSDAPRRAARLPSVARRLRLCLCDSRRSVHRTRAPNTTRAALPVAANANSTLPATRFSQFTCDLL
ncbi:unnamed protein product, partial [Brenthis ino]